MIASLLSSSGEESPNSPRTSRGSGSEVVGNTHPAYCKIGGGKVPQRLYYPAAREQWGKREK